MRKVSFGKSFALVAIGFVAFAVGWTASNTQAAWAKCPNQGHEVKLVREQDGDGGNINWPNELQVRADVVSGESRWDTVRIEFFAPVPDSGVGMSSWWAEKPR